VGRSLFRRPGIYCFFTSGSCLSSRPTMYGPRQLLLNAAMARFFSDRPVSRSARHAFQVFGPPAVTSLFRLLPADVIFSLIRPLSILFSLSLLQFFPLQAAEPRQQKALEPKVTAWEPQLARGYFKFPSNAIVCTPMILFPHPPWRLIWAWRCQLRKGRPLVRRARTE